VGCFLLLVLTAEIFSGETPMGIGKSIKFLRMAKGLKQSELATKLGKSTNYLSLVENDKREPSLSFLKNLADELEVPLSLFFLDMDFSKRDFNPQEQSLFLRIRELVMQLESLRLQTVGNGNRTPKDNNA
jgi:transcriptional regulator with XRE-family HTH domain